VESTRARFGSVLEWIIAAACIVAALGLGSIAVQEIRTFRAFTPVIAEERLPADAPVGVPAGAVSVPMLLLSGGTRLQVGDPARALADALRDARQVGQDSVERGASGDRITRSYADGATRFAVVLESPKPDAAPLVAAIYVH
jgi:hypothetical protein